jgi:hypothetical protein
VAQGRDGAGAGSGRPAAAGRQSRADGGRPHVVKVRLTEEENVRVQARAISLGISAPRLFVETLLSDGRAPVSERHALYRELLGIRRLVALLGSNTNQIARVANTTGEVLPEAAATLAAAGRAAERLEALLATMSPPPKRSTPGTGRGDEPAA